MLPVELYRGDEPLRNDREKVLRRSVELRKRSEEREDDAFDLPPE